MIFIMNFFPFMIMLYILMPRFHNFPVMIGRVKQGVMIYFKQMFY